LLVSWDSDKVNTSLGCIVFGADTNLLIFFIRVFIIHSDLNMFACFGDSVAQRVEAPFSIPILIRQVRSKVTFNLKVLAFCNFVSSTITSQHAESLSVL
jgi:hypothetical protein